MDIRQYFVKNIPAIQSAWKSNNPYTIRQLALYAINELLRFGEYEYFHEIKSKRYSFPQWMGLEFEKKCRGKKIYTQMKSNGFNFDEFNEILIKLYIKDHEEFLRLRRNKEE